MEIAVGIQTCERPEFLRKCINTLIQHNPVVKSWQFIVIDDTSKSFEIEESLRDFDFIDSIIRNYKRMGISVTLKRLVNFILEDSNIDILLCIQADWYCSRSIHFEAISRFFMNFPNIGQIRTIRNKGIIGKPVTRHAGLKNAITGNKVIGSGRTCNGKENFSHGTWCYADLPNFMRREALECLFKDFDLRKNKEYYRMLNMYKDDWEVVMLDNQPFWNQDPKADKRTPGGKR